jgi:hypothetical protein
VQLRFTSRVPLKPEESLHRELQKISTRLPPPSLNSSTSSALFPIIDTPLARLKTETVVGSAGGGDRGLEVSVVGGLEGVDGNAVEADGGL